MRKLTLLYKYLTSIDYRDYRAVRSRHVFDPDYFEQLLGKLHPELHDRYRAFDDPLWAYFILSRTERSKPDAPGTEWRQFCDPHPLFDSWFYLARYGQQIGSRNPFAHYLLVGWKQGLEPGPFFDSDYYASASGWTRTDGDPLSHCIHHWLPAGKRPSVAFDTDWYMDQAPYPDGVRATAVKHYKLHGAPSGKSPVPVFDPRTYLACIGGDLHAQRDPFTHYLCSGDSAGVSASKTFDSAYYRTRHLDTERDTTTLLHYLRAGVHRGAAINDMCESLEEEPVISVIVPVYNPEPRYLRNCIRSVLYQSYPRWELILVDDGSDEETIRDELRTWAGRDVRITCLINDGNLGIARATQAGVETASGAYVGFLDNDDTLATDCLLRVVQAINKSGGSVFYSDEDLVGDDGSHHCSFFKPDFNRALLFSHNYITHFVVVAHSLLSEIGGIPRGVDGAQDYDLMLRLADSGETLYHIPEVLYHWRAIETSTSIAHGQKPYAHEAGKRALGKSLKRNRIAGTVHDGVVNFHYRIEMDDTALPPVTVFTHPEALRRVSEQTEYPRASFRAIGYPGRALEMDPEGAAEQAPAQAKLLNEQISCVDDEYIAVLGNEHTEVTSHWLHELVTKVRLDEKIGIVCGKVSYNGTDGPSFADIDLDNGDPRYYCDVIVSASRHAQGLHNLQWVNACDWSICLIARRVFEHVGGIDYREFPALLPLVELCYRVSSAGYRVLYTPDAVAMMPGFSDSLPCGEDEAEEEVARFRARHAADLMQFDRYYNSGRIEENGYEREMLYQWLTGLDCKELLTERPI